MATDLAAIAGINGICRTVLKETATALDLDFDKETVQTGLVRLA
jgi:hypothetical protein